MFVRKEIMYAMSNVLNSGFFCNAGMQYKNYFFHKALRYQFNKKKEGEVPGKTPN